jgi:hypothetical protein
MYFAGLVCIVMLFTDTLDRRKRAPFDWARANPFGALKMLLDNRISATLAACVLLSNVGGALHVHIFTGVCHESVLFMLHLWFVFARQVGPRL